MLRHNKGAHVVEVGAVVVLERGVVTVPWSQLLAMVVEARGVPLLARICRVCSARALELRRPRRQLLLPELLMRRRCWWMPLLR